MADRLYNLSLHQLETFEKSIKTDKANKHKLKQKQEVCMHWVKGQCKKGENNCDYQHVYDKLRLPFCKFLKYEGQCTNEE